MNGKVEFTLKPVTGSASTHGGFRAEVATGKGDVVGIDGVIAEAINYGYINGIKPESAKGIILGVLSSMINRVMDDGRPRRIDDYFTLSLKVHGLFSDETDEFGTSRHKLALSLKQLNAYRPSFDNVTATNINHKRQFRIYSIRSIGEDGNEGRNGRLVQGRDFVITGGDLLAKDGRHGVVMHLRSPSGDRPSVNPRIISATDSRIHCAWPEELSGEEFLGMLCEVVVYKLPPQEDPLTYPRREIKAVIVQA